MTRRIVKDVHPGQIWVDRDKRSFSGNRKVRVIETGRTGLTDDTVYVKYRQVIGAEGYEKEFSPVFTSRYKRFQRAFDLVRDVVRT